MPLLTLSPAPRTDAAPGLLFCEQGPCTIPAQSLLEQVTWRDQAVWTKRSSEGSGGVRGAGAQRKAQVR